MECMESNIGENWWQTLCCNGLWVLKDRHYSLVKVMFYEDNTIRTHFCYEMFVDAFIFRINDLQGSETETNKVLEKEQQQKKDPWHLLCSNTYVVMGQSYIIFCP